MSKPLVSILVPIYNVEKYIERCAISLMEQSYDNIEYVFVNDYTKDESVNILKRVIERYPNRQKVKIINHSQNKGLSASRNTGITNSSGDYISFVDSDDYLDKYAIELMVNIILEENAEIVVSNFKYVTEFGLKKFIRPKERYNKIEYIQSLLRWNEIDLTLWGKLFRKDIFTKNNIRSLEGYNFGEDYAVLPRVSYYANKIVFTNYVSYYYEYSNNNSYTKKISEQSLYSLVHIAKEIGYFFKTKKDYEYFRQDLSIGLINMQFWIYNVSKNISYINDLQRFMNNYNIKPKGFYIMINFLLSHNLFRIANSINKIIRNYVRY